MCLCSAVSAVTAKIMTFSYKYLLTLPFQMTKSVTINRLNDVTIVTVRAPQHGPGHVGDVLW